MDSLREAHEFELAAHARTCPEAHGGAEECGMGMCSRCLRSSYTRVLGVCTDCRHLWAEYPATFSEAWCARLREHGLSVAGPHSLRPYWTPLYVCEPCAAGMANKRVTMHARSIEAHMRDWHGVTMPACLRMLSEAEHEARGWDTHGYPEYITHAPVGA